MFRFIILFNVRNDSSSFNLFERKKMIRQAEFVKKNKNSSKGFDVIQLLINRHLLV